MRMEACLRISFASPEAPIEPCLAFPVQMVFFSRLTDSMAPNWASATKRVGGQIHMDDAGSVRLRVLIDHSAVEVFTGSGEVLTTR